MSLEQYIIENKDQFIKYAGDEHYAIWYNEEDEYFFHHSTHANYGDGYKLVATFDSLPCVEDINDEDEVNFAFDCFLQNIDWE